MAAHPDAIPAGRPAFFAEQTVRGVYAAGNVLFLMDPARLTQHLAGDPSESRLLESFTAHGPGAALCREGLLVPAFGLEAGYYTVLVRSTETEDAFTPLTHIVYSAGFVLGTPTGGLLLANADYFRRAGAAAPAHHGGAERHVHVSPGWYSVTVVAGIRESQDDQEEGWVCAFLLDPQESQPAFAADLSITLSFFAG